MLTTHRCLFSAYELYRANLTNDWKSRSLLSRIFRSKASHEKAVEKVKQLCAQFKQTLSHKNARVHFVGIW